MIQASELRIGNKFTWVDEEDTYMLTLVGVFGGDDGADVWVSDLDGDINDVFIESIRPIPLSPEILEKCGFVTVTHNNDGSYNFWGKKNDASIDLDLDGCYRYRVCERVRTKSIQYLHQLQNLYFALTGQELTINL